MDKTLETQIIGAYKRGDSTRVIASKHDVSISTVYRILEKNNVERGRCNAELEEHVLNSLRAGQHIRDIMQVLGCSQRFIYSVKRKHFNNASTNKHNQDVLKNAKNIQIDKEDGMTTKEMSEKYGLSRASIYRLLKLDVADAVTYFMLKPEYNDGTYLTTPQPLGYFITNDIDMSFLNSVMYNFNPLVKKPTELSEIVKLLKNNQEKLFRLGIIGPKYIGKSYLANQIKDLVDNCIVDSFAEPVKQEINYYDRIKDTPKEMLREELIELSERRKLIDPMYWVNKALEKPIPDGIKTIIYDDVRFIPEAMEMDMLVIIDGPFSNEPGERGFLQKEVDHFKKQGIIVKRYRGGL